MSRTLTGTGATHGLDRAPLGRPRPAGHRMIATSATTEPLLPLHLPGRVAADVDRHGGSFGW